jgi:adenylate kinase family enzyme
MAKLMIQRLCEPDCEFNGYIILDFPDTVAQFNMLHKSNKIPKIMILREYETETIYQTLSDYKLDMETGLTLYKSESINPEMYAKLPTHPMYNKKSIDLRLEHWDRNKD